MNSFFVLTDFQLKFFRLTKFEIKSLQRVGLLQRIGELLFEGTAWT